MMERFDMLRDDLAAFCQRWKIVELDLFGSALREDFHPGSDIDLLVRFAPDARWDLLDMAAMESELEERGGGHKVEIVSKKAVENSRNAVRRQAILSAARPLFRAEAWSHAEPEESA